MKKAILALMILAVSAGASFAERGDGDRDWKRGGRDGGMRKEMKAEMKAQMKALRQMGKDIRAETDEAKKTEMTDELRVKVGELVDAKAKKLEEHAKKKIEKLESKVEGFKANRDEMIDEKVERLISGKGPKRGDTDAFREHPRAKGGRGGDRGHGRRGPDQDDDDTPPPPPPEDDDAPADEDAPPPSE